MERECVILLELAANGVASLLKAANAVKVGFVYKFDAMVHVLQAVAKTHRVTLVIALRNYRPD